MPNKEQDEWLRVIGAVVESARDAVEAVASPFEGKSDQSWENGTVLADAPTGPPKDKTTTPTQAKPLVNKCSAIKKGPLTYAKPTVTQLPKGGWIVEVPDKQEGPFKTEREVKDAARRMAKEAQDELGDVGQKDDECVHKGADWIHQDGTYWVSVPSAASGTLPLVVLFGGTNGKLAVCKQTPQSYFDKAILVFAEMSGSFSGAEGVLKKVLKKPGLAYSVVTICGYSGGGPAALAASSSANHALGLIDPTLHAKDKFNAKTILSIYESGAWDLSDRDTPEDPKDSKKNTGTVEQARHAALQKVLDAGGYAETTCVQHYSYPQYFLKTFKSDLLP